MSSPSNTPLAVVLTALPVEYAAVRSFLKNITEDNHPEGTVYERGLFSHNGKEWEVVIVEIGAGNVRAAVEAERALNFYTPEKLFSSESQEASKTLLLATLSLARRSTAMNRARQNQVLNSCHAPMLAARPTAWNREQRLKRASPTGML